MTLKILFFLLIFPFVLRGQQLVSAAGGTLRKDGATLSFSIGEIATATLRSNNAVATQGVQQPPLSKKLISLDSIRYFNLITLDDDGIGDKKNDVFFIDSLQKYPDNRLIVANRWGEIVFSTDDKAYQNDWKGTDQNGSPLPYGTYYFLFYPSRAEPRFIKGSILILR